jgi:hypothetical protein
MQFEDPSAVHHVGWKRGDPPEQLVLGPADGENRQSFASEKELAKLAGEWPDSRLVDAWNNFAGVALFTGR